MNKDKLISKINTSIFVAINSITGGMLSVWLVISLLELIATVLNVLNIVIDVNFKGIMMNSFYKNVSLSPKIIFSIYIIGAIVFLLCNCFDYLKKYIKVINWRRRYD